MTRSIRGGTLSLVVTGLAAVASLLGLLVPGLYRDEPMLASSWRINDLVTLALVAPVLVAARHHAARGSSFAHWVWIGALHYMLYNFAFYVFGAVLNGLLLVHIAIVALSGWSLVLALRDLDLASANAMSTRVPAKRVAAWMLFVSLGLTVTWTAQWIVALLRTTAPQRFDVTAEFIRVTAGIDLSLMVAILVPGAILLWRRRPWGVVLGTALNVSGALYNVVLAAGTVVQIRAGLTGAWPLLFLWLALGVGCAACAQRLHATTRPPNDARGRIEHVCRDVVSGGAGAAIMIGSMLTPFLRSSRSHWGFTKAQAAEPRPGDELVASPRWGWTHAVEIERPAEDVWPWIAQIGADRAGFYSYEFLENLAGCGIRNAQTIHDEWHVREGDALSLHPRIPAMRVVSLDPG
jgi:hypothetical protein